MGRARIKQLLKKDYTWREIAEEAETEHRAGYVDELAIAFLNGLSVLIAMLPIPTSMASLSSLSVLFFSEFTVLAVWDCIEGSEGSKRRGPELIHG